MYNSKTINCGRVFENRTLFLICAYNVFIKPARSNVGAKHKRMENIMKKSIVLIIVLAVIIITLTFVFLWIHGFEITKFIPRCGNA